MTNNTVSAASLVKLLKEKKLTLATAESCTGGMLASRITSAPGASEVFGYGVVTYANEAKMKLLGVKKETLDAHGAVSRETACEMALGLLALSGADIAVSVTGIAGPGGGTAEKPVGTVWICCATKEKINAVTLKTENLSPLTRSHIRCASVAEALRLVKEAAQI